jgi:hypothetical protein
MLRLVIATERMGSVIEIHLIRKGVYHTRASSGVIQYKSLCFSPTLFFEMSEVSTL